MASRTAIAKPTTQLGRDREKSRRESEVVHGRCANPERREAAIDDPALFLKTYFPTRFYNPWAIHHLEMIRAIEHAAKFGGDQAIAAPRGDGKTEICTAMIVWAILAGFVRCPVIVASTAEFAKGIFKEIKLHFESNDLLQADFPEVCDYVRDLDGAPSRANKQHNGGKKTRIVWTQDKVVLPNVDGSSYGGVTIVYRGLDSAIRGIRPRPDFVLIDDPETKESAKSDSQIADRTLAIERDIAGLSGPDKSLARVMLTTIQNRRCLSYVFTDPKVKPSWHGRRFKALVKEPDNTELWEEYIALRQQDQQNEDKATDNAGAFYLANREAMDAGAVMGNPYRIKPGSISALQTFYNQVADNGIGFALSELQNDPEDDSPIDSLKLRPGTIQKRMSGLQRHELPKVDSQKILVGLDIGKYVSYWVKLSLYGNGTGHVIDYGVMETHGVTTQTDDTAIEVAILKSLELWRMDIMARNTPDAVMVDTGDFTPAIYEFIRRYGAPFYCSKGWEGGRLEMSGANSPTRLFFEECRADFQQAAGVWLYNFNSWHWKYQVHQRFLTQTFNEAQIINDGSLSVWSTDDTRQHLAYSHHICAEERTEKFVEGKGMVRKWEKNNPNNHWLDATAMALMAGGVLGVRVLPRVTTTGPTQPQNQPKPQTQSRFRQRPGGWLKGLRK
jgi:hypothetical protein